MAHHKSAKKRIKTSEKKRVRNKAALSKVKTLVKEMRTSPTPKALTRAYQALDRASKHGIMHPNKAARLKSRLAKLLKKK